VASRELYDSPLFIERLLLLSYHGLLIKEKVWPLDTETSQRIELCPQKPSFGPEIVLKKIGHQHISLDFSDIYF